MDMLVFGFVVLGILLTAFVFWAVINLRRTHPNVVWIGLLLCAFSPAGQFYVKKHAWPYFIIDILMIVVAKAVADFDTTGLITLSVMPGIPCALIYLRIIKARSAAESISADAPAA